MTIKHEILIIAVLIAATLGTAHALESGMIDLATLAQKVLTRG